MVVNGPIEAMERLQNQLGLRSYNSVRNAKWDGTIVKRFGRLLCTPVGTRSPLQGSADCATFVKKRTSAVWNVPTECHKNMQIHGLAAHKFILWDGCRRILQSFQAFSGASLIGSGGRPKFSNCGSKSVKANPSEANGGHVSSKGIVSIRPS